MNRKILLLAAILLLLTHQSFSQSDSNTTFLTVEDINFKSLKEFESLKIIDEQGNIMILTYEEINNLFENTSLESEIFITEGSKLSMGFDSEKGGIGIVFESGKLKFTFVENGKKTTVGVFKGSQFAVQKISDNQYTLMLNETVKLSPPD